MDIALFQLNELREYIVNCLRELIDNKTILLYGQAFGSELTRQYFLDAGAVNVLDLPLPQGQTRNISDLFQAQNDSVLNPSGEMADVLHKVDPLKEAQVFAGSSVSAETLDGRKVLGRRLPIWRELERKRHQTEMTRKQGGYDVSYIDFLNGYQQDDLFEYCARNRSCILSGDPKNSVAMGTDYVYIAHKRASMESIERICKFLYKECEGVRVAPISIGTPATYYGFVLDGTHVLYGPVEAIVGFRASDYRVVAPGILIPISVSRKLAREGEQRVVDVLENIVEQTGYRGAFGVDGCFTENGFIIHEFNTRICAGFSLISRVFRDLLPFGIIDMIVRELEPDRCKPLLGLLKSIAGNVSNIIDLKLWERGKLEKLLRNRIPNGGNKTDLEKWKAMVRKKVLPESIPFIVQRK